MSRRPPQGHDSLVHEHSLIDQLLADQARLDTPVAEFSRHHHTGVAQPSWRRLIPLSKPGPGEQYAFEVNLDQCTGCKACVAACHSMNGLDPGETWRDVGLVFEPIAPAPAMQTVTTACHHCLDPACAAGCPVLAYEKDADTGIVRHLDDQCIGCSYCILKCPYDVPKYNVKLGIVRKCDLCHGRLAADEAPACVQACPTEAIAVRLVKPETVPASARIVGGAFDSAYTQPTTRYTSTRSDWSTARPADDGQPRVEDAHTPLAVMLVFTQLATGSLLGALLFPRPSLLWLAAVTGMLGVIASTLHLGQPLKAFRAFLGWRRSWLSREILAFGGLVPAAFGTALRLVPVPLAAVLGLLSVACSVMVYADTRRPTWDLPRVTWKFLGTTLLLGATATGLLLPACLLTLAKLTAEAALLTRRDLTARVQLGPLRRWTLTRFALPLAGLALLPFSPPAALILLTAGEIIERSLFFRAVTANRMPGL